MKNPDPKVWPRCSECKTDYVLRRAVVFSTDHDGPHPRAKIVVEWVWQRDCKHRKAKPEVARSDDKQRKGKKRT